MPSLPILVDVPVACDEESSHLFNFLGKFESSLTIQEVGKGERKTCSDLGQLYLEKVGLKHPKHVKGQKKGGEEGKMEVSGEEELKNT